MNTIKNTPLALVTGASRGIGRAIAETLAGAGYDLILTCSHTLAKLQDVAASLEEKYGVHCTALAADAADPSAIEKIFASLFHFSLLLSLFYYFLALILRRASLSHSLRSFFGEFVNRFY